MSLIGRAITESQANRWNEARALFEQAHRLNPNSRTLRGLGIASYENSDYVRTIDYLEAALADTRKPLSQRQVSEIQDILEQAHAFVGRFRVELQPSTTQLVVDGYPVKLSPDGLLRLNPGDHDLIAQANGYQRLQRHLQVASGKEAALKLELEADGAATNTTLPPAAHGADDTGWPLPAVITAAGGGALLLGSLVTGVLTENARSELRSSCDPDGLCPPDSEATKSRGETLRTATHVLLGTGLVTVATGVILWVLLDTEDTPPVSAACDRHGCQALFRGVL